MVEHRSEQAADLAKTEGVRWGACTGIPRRALRDARSSWRWRRCTRKAAAVFRDTRPRLATFVSAGAWASRGEHGCTCARVEITEQPIIADIIGLTALADALFQDTNTAVGGEITAKVVPDSVARHIGGRTLVRPSTWLIFDRQISTCAAVATKAIRAGKRTCLREATGFSCHRQWDTHAVVGIACKPRGTKNALCTRHSFAWKCCAGMGAVIAEEPIGTNITRCAGRAQPGFDDTGGLRDTGVTRTT